MKLRFFGFLSACLLTATTPAQAALRVFACEPEWGALATALGASDVFTATTARQDPHQIQARPALIARLRAADLAVCTGAELEVGWMPALTRQAANPRVQPGAAGYFEAAAQVTRLEIPTRLDRADGDVHPSGNPHIQTDPRNIRAVAAALAQRMTELDPGGAAAYAAKRDDFLARWDSALARWQSAGAALRGTRIVVYHKNWAYLENWLGLVELATIEPKPGVPPGGAYLAQLLTDIPRLGAQFILGAAYENPRAAQFVAEKSGLPLVIAPFTVGGDDQAGDLFALFDDTVARLAATKEKSNAR